MHLKSFREYFSSRLDLIRPRVHGNTGSAGFTLIELLLFSAIFTILMISFVSILVTVTSIYGKQSGVTEVNQQSQFLLQQIQYYTERASLIELAPDVATTTLKLRMTASAEDPTYLYLSGGVLYLKQTDAGTPQPLTSSKVTVSSVSFTKRQNAPGHDSVSVAFIIAFRTQNLKQQFSEALQTAVARVSAATFDSNVIPSSAATYKLGLAGQTWSSVNDLIYFNGSNVGIGTPSANSKLQVSGGDVYIDTINNGLVLKAPNGISCYRVTITNTGSLATSSISCP